MWVSQTASTIICLSLLAALATTFGALLVILVLRPRKLGQAVRNLATAVVPFVVALALWAVIPLPFGRPVNVIMAGAGCVLVVFAAVRAIRVLVRSSRSQ